MADAERDAAEARGHLEDRIADAVREAKGQAEQAQLERDIAFEDRDEAKRAVEKAEHKTRIMEGLLRKHGLGLADAFVDADAVARVEG